MCSGLLYPVVFLVKQEKRLALQRLGLLTCLDVWACSAFGAVSAVGGSEYFVLRHSLSGAVAVCAAPHLRVPFARTPYICAKPRLTAVLLSPDPLAS